MLSRNLLRGAGFCLVSSFASAAVIQIDFGTTQTAGWNNVTSVMSGVTIANLTDTETQLTGIRLEVTDRFNGVNSSGTSSTTSGFPQNATRDSFYSTAAGVNFGSYTEDDGNSTIVFSGLDANSTYSFRFYASRVGSDVTDNRETRYEVIGTTTNVVFLDAAKNITNSVVTSAISADAQGKITLNVSAGPNNTNGSGFYYLGFVEITSVSTIPEPATYASLAGLMAAGLAGWRRRR